MTDVTMFKTIHECRLELVAHTVELIEPDATFESDRTVSAEWLPVSAARASFQNEDKTGKNPKNDLRLLNSLVRDGHMGVFEHQSATFLIECPLFIRSQIMRHRTGAYNEWSRRYTSEKIAFWIPDKWRKQSESNKQASTDESLETVPIKCRVYTLNDNVGTDYTDHHDIGHLYEEPIFEAMIAYKHMVDGGVCREQARAVLPQSLLTQFYMTMNLRNWVHFLRLRLDSHSQYEVRAVAERIAAKLRELWPVPMSVLLPEETKDEAI
jgi:thymidylate synthase (FAD)